MWQKLKSFLTSDPAFYSVLILVVALGSFGLGRHSVKEEEGSEKPLFVKENATPAAAVTAVGAAATTSAPALATLPSEPSVIKVVGSKSGSKYHLPTCSGAKRIKPENLITFESIDAAKAAGYTAAANCKGLE